MSKMDKNNEYQLLQLHKELLALLGEFHSFCKNQGIKYSLGYGSLLGAVRDKGIIPWDDDIDIIIDRINYNKLVKEFLYINSSLALERNTKTTLWIDRIHFKDKISQFQYQPTIDIFVIDSVPKYRISELLKLYLILFIQGTCKTTYSNKGNFFEKLSSIISLAIGFFMPLKFKLELLRFVSALGGSSSISAQKECYNVEYIYVKKKFQCNILEKCIEVPFDNICASVTAEYHSVLTTLYKDYMTPVKILAKHSR